MSHFPFLVWNHHHHGFWHLHGHSHGSLNAPEYYERKVIDVGVDTNDYWPYHFDDIYEIMESRGQKFIDHHN